MSGDRKPRSLRLVVTTQVTLSLITFSIGMPAMIWVGGLMDLPRFLRPGVALMIDGGLTVMGLSVMSRRIRELSTRFARFWLVVLTLMSMGLQAAHVMANPHLTSTERVVALGFAVAIPLVLLASTHILIEDLVAIPETQQPVAVAVSEPPAHAERVRFDALTAPVEQVPHGTPVAVEATVAEPAFVPAQRPSATRTTRVARRPAEKVAPTADRPSDAEVLALKESGMSNSQIAMSTGMSKSSVQRAIDRARAPMAA